MGGGEVEKKADRGGMVERRRRWWKKEGKEEMVELEGGKRLRKDVVEYGMEEGGGWRRGGVKYKVEKGGRRGIVEYGMEKRGGKGWWWRGLVGFKSRWLRSC